MPGIQGAVENAIMGVLKTVFGFIADKIDILFSIASDYLTSTPYPDNLYSFGPPTKGLWTQLYHNLYDQLVIVLLPSLFGLALGLAMFFNIFTPKQKKVSIKRAVFAYPLAISWWWFGGWFLKFTNDLATLLLADASLTGDIGSQIGSSAGAVILGLLIYIFGATAVLVIIAIYLLRRIAIYAYMVAMPLLLMFWVVPIQPVSGWAKSMMGKFVPLVLMTVPTALLLRIGTMFIGGETGAAAAAASSSDVSRQLVSTILGFGTIAGAALVPKYMFSFSGGVSRAVKKSSRAGMSAARGARAGQAPSRGRTQAASASSSGGRSERASRARSGETADKHKHNPEEHLNFKRPKGRRRRQQQRAGKAGAFAGKVAKKPVDGAARTSRSVIRNKNADGSTIRGIGGDAKEAAKQGTSKRMQRIQQRMAARRDEITEKFTPGSRPPSQGQSALDDFASSEVDGESEETGGSEIDQEWMNDLSTDDGGWAEDWGGDGGGSSSPSVDERAGDSRSDTREMDSSDVGESSEEWSRSDANTAEFSTSTRIDDYSSPDGDENSDG